MNSRIKYDFSAEMWRHSSAGGWHFVSLPSEVSKEIREHLKWQEEGWGRMKAYAQIGELMWGTSIWFDAKKGTYILPLKAEIRNKLNLKFKQKIKIGVWV